MLKIAIIVFREILEISLVIGILSVATKGIKGRKRWISCGIAFGILGSILLAFSTNAISSALEGVGQEVFNALILLTSAALISWTVLWMQKYGKKSAANLKKLGSSLSNGEKSLVILVPVVALSVLREGAEIVLFSYGSFISGDNIMNLILGGIIGLTCGIFAGLCLYFGLMKVLGKHFFSATSWLLIFLAAGMASSAIGFLSKATIIPEIIYPIWDSSNLISQKGILGEILHALFGYIERPSLVQLLTYLLIIGTLAFGIKKNSRR